MAYIKPWISQNFLWHKFRWASNSNGIRNPTKNKLNFPEFPHEKMFPLSDQLQNFLWHLISTPPPPPYNPSYYPLFTTPPPPQTNQPTRKLLPLVQFNSQMTCHILPIFKIQLTHYILTLEWIFPQLTHQIISLEHHLIPHACMLSQLQPYNFIPLVYFYQLTQMIPFSYFPN